MTEMDAMAVKVLGDDSSYQKMMSSMEKKTIDSMKKIDSSLTKVIDNVSKKMIGLGTKMSIGLTAPFTLFAGASIHGFAEEEQATRKLEAALKANGRQVQETLADYTEFAAEMQRLTVVGDETTIGMLQQAESFGITGDNAKRAVQNAIAMQSAFGMNAESAMRLTVQLEKGNAQMLSRYIPTLKGIKSPIEKAAKAQEFLANAFKVSEAEAKSGLGPLMQLKNTYGDLQEMFGKILLEALNPIIARGKEVVLWLQGLSESTKKWILWLGLGAAAVGPILVFLGGAGILITPLVAGFAAVGAFMAAWAPFALTVAAIAAGIGLVAFMLVGSDGLVGAWQMATEWASFFFTTVVGFFANFRHNVFAIFSWFRDNWRNMFTDAGNLLLTFITNAAHNYQTLFMTFMRIGVAFAGWLTALWQGAFSTDLVNAVVSGGIQFVVTLKKILVQGSMMVMSWSIDVATMIAKAFTEGPSAIIGTGLGAVSSLGKMMDQATSEILKDGIKGGSKLDFFSTIGDIIKEQMGKLKGPIDGFKSTITEGPDLIFDFDMGIFKSAKNAEKAKKPFEGLAGAIGKVGKEMKGVEATESGTTEALARLLSFRALSPDATNPAPVADEVEAGMADAVDDGTDDSVVSNLSALVGLMQINNELTAGKEDVVFEAANLA